MYQQWRDQIVITGSLAHSQCTLPALGIRYIPAPPMSAAIQGQSVIDQARIIKCFWRYPTQWSD